jgi:predicted phage tail protein
MADLVYMASPAGEVKEVEATAEALSPLMSTGWIQVATPAAAQKPVVVAKEEHQHG